MKFRVGACALLVCLAGCTAETPDTKFGDQRGSASANTRTAQRLPSVQTGREAAQSIANAPDRGELISYKNKGAAIKREGAYTWYPVAISEAHALKAVVDGVMTIPSPDGSQVKVRYERHVEHPDGNWTWIGRVIGGDQKQEAILTFGEKAVFGSIPQKTGAPLNLQTRSGMLYAVATDLSKVKNPNNRSDMMVPPAAAFHSTLLATASKAQESQSAAETKAASAATTVDVAIGYSAGLRAVYGSQSATVTRLINLVDVGNQAFNNSLINGALRIVSAVEVNYADNTTNKAALSELTGVDDNEVVVPIPASLTPLRDARNQYGADLAVLVRKFQTPENDGCGIAWLNGSGGVSIDPATDDDFGFAVISDGTDAGTDGNNYFCAEETLVHEIGHLMGSAHDRDNSKKKDGSQLFGRYPYSFGMKTDVANGNFYTIMAYGSNNQNFYRTFSNPLVLKCGPGANLACGVTDQTDNARSLNQTIPVVATFRATVVPIKQKLYADYNGDGLSDAVWRNSTSGENIVWWSANADTRTQIGFVPGPAWQIVAAGDFGGDGLSDLFWRNSTTGENIIWRSANPANIQQGQAVADASWRIAGSGDFNGDGKYDIFWRNSSTGANIIWWSGLFAGNTTVQTVPVAWIIAGIGDFNSDGQSDVLWRNPTNGENIIWFSGNPASILYTQAVVGATWQVVGTGDFNGDGKSDLFWRNSTSGVNIIWWSGSFNNASGVATVPNSWKVAATGDYNGDGLYDLLWRNSVSGENSIWFSATPAIFRVLPLIADQSWQVKP